MGQRLVINVCEGDKILANAYFHWDAFTSTAANRLLEIDEFIKNNIVEHFVDKKDYAVTMLKHLGASLSKDYKDETSSKNNGMFDRANGLIHVSEAEIEDIISWADGMIVVDIGEQKIYFDVFKYYSEDEFVEMKSDNDNIIESEEYFHCSFDDIRQFSNSILELKQVDFIKYDNSYFGILE